MIRLSASANPSSTRRKHLTLRSPEALDALAGFYEHVHNHPTMRLSFRYLTNASIGHEAASGSSATGAGVDLWTRVQNGALSGKERESAAEHIRSLLRSARRPDKLNRSTWGRFHRILAAGSIPRIADLHRIGGVVRYEL